MTISFTVIVCDADHTSEWADYLLHVTPAAGGNGAPQDFEDDWQDARDHVRENEPDTWCMQDIMDLLSDCWSVTVIDKADYGVVFL